MAIYSLSTEKIISHLGNLSKNKITLSYEKKVLHFDPPDTINISPLFFRSYRCLGKCGWCCPKFSLDYYPYNVKKFKEMYPNEFTLLTPFWFKVDGVEKVAYVDFQKEQKINRCKYLTEPQRRCMIHQENPLSCRMEIIKTMRNRGVVTLIKRGFSRGWMERFGSKAICDIGGFDKDQFLQDIEFLEELLTLSEYLSIETYLPEIIEQLKKVDTSNIPTNKIEIK